MLASEDSPRGRAEEVGTLPILGAEPQYRKRKEEKTDPPILKTTPVVRVSWSATSFSIFHKIRFPTKRTNYEKGIASLQNQSGYHEQ